MTIVPRRNGLLAIISAAGIAAACSASESSPRAAARPCPTPRDTILGKSVETFIKSAQPTAYRFLIATGTDSALPPHGHWPLQGRTPLYYYPADPAQQQKFVTDLYRRGNYPTLLVSYHGQDTLEDGRIRTMLSGSYIGGSNAGKTMPQTAVVFDCQATGATRFTIGNAAPVSADTSDRPAAGRGSSTP
jgi:hypothetical protein